MPYQATSNKLTQISFTLAGTEFSANLTSFTLTDATKAPDQVWTYSISGDGYNSTFEDADPEWSLDLQFLADWSAGSLNDYLMTNSGQVVAFVLNHHPENSLQSVRWTGNAYLMRPPVGGDARSTEESKVTLPLRGIPVYSRP